MTKTKVRPIKAHGRPTSGDYLDLVDGIRAERAAPAPRHARPGKARVAVAADATPKDKATFYLAPALVGELRGALAAVAPAELGVLTLSELVEQALTEKLALLRKRHHGGKPFTVAAVRKGRPPRGG